MTHHIKTINYVIHIPAKPEAVYEALLDSEKHSSFTESTAKINPVVGGKFEIMDGYISGTNLKLEPGKRIVQEWITTEWPKGSLSSIVDYSFKAEKEGSEITFIHSRVPSEQAASYKEGWNTYYWKPLKKYFSKKSNK